MALMLALMLAAGQIEASAVTLAAPTAIVEIDVGKLKGDLVRLSWSPDGTQLYLQTSETDRRFNTRLRHFMLGLDGGPPKAIDQEPAWASLYWSRKSSQLAPGVPSLKVDVEQQRKRVNATSNPSGGSLARGVPPGSATGSGTETGMGIDDAARAAEQGQTANVVTLRLKGQVIGEFVNTAAIPGLTFSWGPANSGLVAFVGQDGKVVIMDALARTQKLAGSTSALLPAWTADGKRLAYLEKKGRSKLTLHIVDVTIRGQ